MYSFMRTDAAIIITENREYSIFFWLMIDSMDVLKSSIPMSRMRKETIRPEMYSIRPCPKGCSSSGFFPASLNPSTDTKDDAASERLLKESANMATDFVTIAPISFETNSNMFRKMPKVLQRIP